MGVDFHIEFHRVALDRIQDNFLVGRERSLPDVLAGSAQGSGGGDRFNAEALVGAEGEALGEGEDMVPAVNGLTLVEVEDVDDAALAISRGGRRVNTGGSDEPVIEPTVIVGGELELAGVVVPPGDTGRRGCG